VRDLPAGTVTLLFTDVEGSTRLLAEQGDRYAELLAEHRRLLREAFLERGGVEVDTQGDAFFVAFERASDALAAAERAQAALADTPVRVRIGLHTGEPQPAEEGYVGMDVHRGARIAAAGHGGQVLVSEQTARLLEGVRLRDLGVHRLKDVGDLRIYQLGEGDFPPLKTLYQTNLPTPANPLVGRKKELIDVVRLLAVERARAVTLTGPGGIGKTRFSLAAATEVTEAFADGVWFVDLSPVREPTLVVPTIAATLGAEVELHEHVGARELLVVLDNLEQVVEAAPELGTLIDACPRLQLLGTSREPLRIAPEREYPLKPLPESPAVELFRQRARAAAANCKVDYELAAQICDRLDRLPLAIELAAARVKVLDPPALLERLDRRLPLLTTRSRDLPERQRTLHSTIAWSYELLPPEEQELFRRLAVFAGGTTLEAVEAVCDGDIDLLEALVDKSLLRRRGERFVMLETIREYALERLDESGEADDLRRRHANFFLELARSANLTMEAEDEQRHELIIPERDNVRVALEWASAAGEIELGLQLVAALENYWVTNSQAEGRRWARELLDAGEELPGILRAEALRTIGNTAIFLGEPEEGTRAYEASLAEYRRIGDVLGIAIMLQRLAVRASRRGEPDAARALADESLDMCRHVAFTKGEAVAVGVLAQIELDAGNEDRGFELLEQSAALAEESGFWWWLAGTLLELSELLLERGRFLEAESRVREALPLVTRMGDRQRTIFALALFARLAAETGEPERAGRLWGVIEAEEARAPIGANVWEAERDALAGAIESRAAGHEFERGRATGRRLSLDEVVEEALEVGHA
jgi:predicted ATPase